MTKKWIQKLHLKKGALHRELHITKGKIIPMAKLKKAAHSKNPTLRKRANLALTFRKFHK